jgi:hypothetical protein
LNKNDSFFRINCPYSMKRTGHCAWPCCSFSWNDCTCDDPSCCRTWCYLSPCCHVEGNCGIDCLDDNSWISNYCIALITSMVVAIFMTTMLIVARFMATRGRKMSHFLFLWLLLVLGNHLENPSHLIGCLTLLKESNHIEWVGRHHLVQVWELVLVHLRLRKVDLLTLLLHCGYFHCSTEVATLERAEKLHLMMRELVHWHEGGLLGRTKPENQLVTHIWETGDSLEVIPDTLVVVCLHTICIILALLCDDAGPLGQAYVLKAPTHEAKQQWTIVLLRI